MEGYSGGGGVGGVGSGGGTVMATLGSAIWDASNCWLTDNMV